MSEPRLSPPDQTSSIPDETTLEQRIRVWLDLLDANEELLLAGLQREIGPDGDLKAAYRRWYAEHMEEHERMLIHLMEEFERRGGGHGR